MSEPVVKISIPPARAKRNWAIAIGLIAFVVIIYVVTVVKIHIHGGVQP
ncbi:MAG: hypothetical protein SFW65_06610 [Alphaproteobacteria bacterium]|nr:hypothetical protein [Alphaproteobacteria bacterium]